MNGVKRSFPIPVKGAVSEAVCNGLAVTINKTLCVADHNCRTIDPLDPDTRNPDAFWIADPTAHTIAQDIEFSGLPSTVPLDQLFRLPMSMKERRVCASTSGVASTKAARKPDADVPLSPPPPINLTAEDQTLEHLLNENATVIDSGTTIGLGKSWSKTNTRTRRKRKTTADPKETANISNIEIREEANKFVLQPLFEFGRYGRVHNLLNIATVYPTHIDPVVLLENHMPNGNIPLANGESVTVPEWVYGYFDHSEPGALYLGHDHYYTWYPVEVDQADASLYTAYLSVVSRVHFLERLIMSNNVPLVIRKILTTIQDSYHRLIDFMDVRNMYTDEELLSPATFDFVPEREPRVLPSGKQITVRVSRFSPQNAECAASMRVLIKYCRAYGARLGIDWHSLGPDDSYIGVYGPNFEDTFHMGSLPNLLSLLEYVGMINDKDKHDIPFADQNLRKVIEILQKAGMNPLRRRDCNGMIRESLPYDKNPIAYNVFYQIVVASMCGYYPHNTYCTSFYLRNTVHRSFVIGTPKELNFRMWMNAQYVANPAGTEAKIFHRCYAIVSIIQEFVYFMIESTPSLCQAMGDNFYSDRIMNNLFRSMDEYRRLLDSCVYGRGPRWERFQQFNDLYTTTKINRKLRSKLDSKPLIPLYTMYDRHFLNLSSNTFNHQAFLSPALAHFVIRFFVESLYQAPERYLVGAAPGLEAYLCVPYLWVCKGGSDTDTVTTIVTRILVDQISTYSAIAALVLRPEVLRLPADSDTSPEAYAESILRTLFKAVLPKHLDFTDDLWYILYGQCSFEQLLDVYTGPSRTVCSDFRENYYTLHGVHLVRDNVMCNCPHCCSLDNPRQAYRELQDLFHHAKMGDYFFSGMLNYMAENLLYATYQYRVKYMFRMSNLPFVPHMVWQMETLLLERKNDVEFRAALNSVTEEERRYVAFLVASSNPNTIGLEKLMDVPLCASVSNTTILIMAKNMYNTWSSTAHPKNLVRMFADESPRDFALYFMFFSEIFNRTSTKFYVLPANILRRQLVAIRNRYADQITNGRIPDRVGSYYYCHLHGNLKAMVVTRFCGEVRTRDRRFETSLGTTNYAVDPASDEIFCRSSIGSAIDDTNENQRGRAPDNPEAPAIQNLMNSCNAVEAFSRATTTKNPKEKTERKSKLVRLRIIDNMCNAPIKRLCMVGNLMCSFNTKTILCPNCATPMTFNAYAFDAYGLNCGQCTLVRARETPIYLTDFLRFACIFCPKNSKLYRASEVFCYDVIDDTHPGVRYKRDVYMCRTHHVPDFDEFASELYMSMLLKVLDAGIVLLHQDDDFVAHEFGRASRFKQRYSETPCRMRKKSDVLIVRSNKFRTPESSVDLSNYVKYT